MIRMEINTRTPPEIASRCSMSPPHEINQLTDNAISSIEKKGTLSRIFRQGEIIIRTRHVPDLNIVCLDVEDNGTGISPEISDQLFEPYTTTKQHGTGLGLTIVSQTISDHNGFTRFRNLDSGGVCFTIELPVT